MIDLTRLAPRGAEMRDIRGAEIALIPQEPMAAFSPVHTVGDQIIEAIQLHGHRWREDGRRLTRAEARDITVGLFRDVGISMPEQRVDAFSWQLSGGLRQRAMIAMALITRPALLIADEPTTALDVTVQAQILDLLQDLQREFNSAVIIITHDLGVIAEMADDVLVMYAGRAVEYGRCKEILTHPEMPYTWGLLSSVPDVASDTSARLIPIPGNPPSLLNPPTGCAFHPRCVHSDKVPANLCSTELPLLTPGSRGETHVKRCHLANPDAVYQAEVLPEIAPELVEEN